MHSFDILVQHINAIIHLSDNEKDILQSLVTVEEIKKKALEKEKMKAADKLGWETARDALVGNFFKIVRSGILAEIPDIAYAPALPEPVLKRYCQELSTGRAELMKLISEVGDHLVSGMLAQVAVSSPPPVVTR